MCPTPNPNPTTYGLCGQVVYGKWHINYMACTTGRNHLGPKARVSPPANSALRGAFPKSGAFVYHADIFGEWDVKWQGSNTLANRLAQSKVKGFCNIYKK